MSKYDEINTAKDLIREVISNGMSTVQEDTNRAADIFGNTSVGTLAELANSEESISGKRVGEMFYFIAFNIWNWRDATSFYNEHTLKIDGLSVREIKDERVALTKDRETAWQQVHEITEQHAEQHGARMKAETALHTAKQEIVTLKAKLYDLMTAGA